MVRPAGSGRIGLHGCVRGPPPYDAEALARLGPGEGAAEPGGRGLGDCDRMYVRDAGRELSGRELPQGRAAFLGAFEDEDSWWSRVFEEVGLGVLGPWPAQGVADTP
ncbi:hypothetical protein OHA91_09755 [Streptomyces erythrochromogenes]|uniref:Uncharacterized protein n=2 Tax=Streptomyces erythrochromogenes TaxID=285574 RepID=A0ABZ1Q7V5_9ACTN|nr:hypothetical protein [Streptomyces erythrochromogenes]